MILELLILIIGICLILISVSMEGSFIGVAGCLILIFSLSGFITGFTSSDYQNQTIEIISLERGNNLEGSFFLGSGYIEDNLIYYAYKKVGEGYQLLKIEDSDYDKLTLYERNETPRYEIIYYCNKERQKPINYLKNLNISCNKERNLIVPEDTIIKEFKT